MNKQQARDLDITLAFTGMALEELAKNLYKFDSINGDIGFIKTSIDKIDKIRDYYVKELKKYGIID